MQTRISPVTPVKEFDGEDEEDQLDFNEERALSLNLRMERYESETEVQNTRTFSYSGGTSPDTETKYSQQTEQRRCSSCGTFFSSAQSSCPQCWDQKNAFASPSTPYSSKPIASPANVVYLLQVPVNCTMDHIRGALSRANVEPLAISFFPAAHAATLTFHSPNEARAVLQQHSLIPMEPFVISTSASFSIDLLVCHPAGIHFASAHTVAAEFSGVFGAESISSCEADSSSSYRINCNSIEAADRALQAGTLCLRLDGSSSSSPLVQEVNIFGHLLPLYVDPVPPFASATDVTQALNRSFQTANLSAPRIALVEIDETCVAKVLLDTTFMSPSDKRSVLALNEIFFRSNPSANPGAAASSSGIGTSLNRDHRATLRDLPRLRVLLEFQGSLPQFIHSPFFENAIESITPLGPRCLEVVLRESSVYRKCEAKASQKDDSFLPFGDERDPCFAAIRLPRIVSSRLDNNKIDELWYRFIEHTPSNVKDYSREHPIWKARWDVKEFKEWWQRFQTGPEYDVHRHRMRTTVALNTIGSVRSGYYFVEDGPVGAPPRRVSIEGPSANSIRNSVYKNDTKISPHPRLKDRPFPTTTVFVVKMDCLLCAQQLLRQGKNPVVLNMASATSRGGGYRKGDGAQEENLFRRSNYYLALDDLEQDALVQPPPYPHDRFGGICSKRVSVFRGPEADGYACLPAPFYMDFIAVAAFRKPKLTPDGQAMKRRFAAGTRRKIETIFDIAIAEGYDTLVLSALGCGAYRNPPLHVALIFRAVIREYAGYFERIFFAVIDDHNSHGNLEVFQRILDGFSCSPSSYTKTLPASFILAQPPPCQKAGICSELNSSDHFSRFSHPGLCPDGARCLLKSPEFFKSVGLSAEAKLEAKVHRHMFVHPRDCVNQGLCNQVHDATHCMFFLHPVECRFRGKCSDESSDHLMQFLHVPPCRWGMECKDKDPEHKDKYRHLQTPCKYGTYCCEFNDPGHTAIYGHVFASPCRFTPDCHDSTPSHLAAYSHLCREGMQCKQRDNESHQERFIHIPRLTCPTVHRGGRCQISAESHLQSYTHPGIWDFRQQCKRGAVCDERFKFEHFSRFSHPALRDSMCLDSQLNIKTKINFRANITNMCRVIASHFRIQDLANAVPEKILDWVRRLRPIHRCSPVIFSSVLVHGVVMSLAYMDFLSNPNGAVHSAQVHPAIQRYLRKANPDLKKTIQDLLFATVTPEYSSANMVPITQSERQQFSVAVRTAMHKFGAPAVQLMQRIAREIAAASIVLSKNKTGIGYNVDLKLGTNHHIFSIVGPHMGPDQYGNVMIMFRREIMYHPDFNFSPLAGTTFHSGHARTRSEWLAHTADPIQDFHQHKLHPGFLGWELPAAAELCARCIKSKMCANFQDVTVDMVERLWLKMDSHHVFEGHLPNVVPLDYIDKVIIPRNVYEAFDGPTKKRIAKELPDRYGHSRIIMGPNCDSAPGHPSFVELAKFSIPLSLVKHHHTHRGIALTIAAAPKFEVSLPIICTFPQKIEHKGTFLDDPVPRELTQQQASAMCVERARTVSKIPGIHVYFRGLGSRFFVCLHENPPAPGRHGQVVSIYINGGTPSHPAYSYILTKSLVEFDFKDDGQLKRADGSCVDFNANLPSSDWVQYHIAVTCSKKAGWVVLQHCGADALINRRVCFARIPKDLVHSLRYISVARENQQDVSFCDFFASRHRVPEMHVKLLDMSQKPPVSVARPAASSLSPSDNPEWCRFGFSCTDHSPPHRARFLHDLAPTVSPAPQSDTPCRFGAACTDHSGSHRARFSHNQAASSGSTIPCRFGAVCTDHSAAHRAQFLHERSTTAPSSPGTYGSYREMETEIKAGTSANGSSVPCRYGSGCTDQSASHRARFLHGSLVSSKSSSSFSANQSPKSSGPDSNESSYSSPSDRGSSFSSPTTSPSFRQHASSPLSPCWWGSGCNLQSDREHTAKFSHNPLTPCRYGSQCNQISVSQHREQFHHPGLRDILIVCPKGRSCHSIQDPKHLQDYKHS